LWSEGAVSAGHAIWRPGTFFWNGAESWSNQCRHCTFRGGRVECGGAPSVLMPSMPDDLVQWPGFLSSCLPATGRLFPDEAGFRRSIPARTECLDWI